MAASPRPRRCNLDLIFLPLSPAGAATSLRWCRGILPPSPARRGLLPPTQRDLALISARLRQAPPGGEVGKGEAEPDEASVLWLRLAQTAPVNGISGAPPPKPSGVRAFGRAPAGAGGGAGAGALPKRPIDRLHACMLAL
jgi:hypothetical protein